MQLTGPLVTGSLTGLAGTATRLTATITKLNQGVYLQCPSGNTAPVTVGVVGVTVGASLAIAAGTTSPLIPVNDLSTVYAISTGGSQSLFWIGA